jgi:hypothetical protein
MDANIATGMTRRAQPEKAPPKRGQVSIMNRASIRECGQSSRWPREKAPREAVRVVR